MTLPLVINPGDTGHIGDHEEIHGLLQAATSPFDVALDGSGTLAARPAAGTEGRYYLATDESVLYRDNGASWVAIFNYFDTWDIDSRDASANIGGLYVPACRVGKSVAQSINNNTTTAITFDTETGSDLYDNDALHSISASTSRITVTRKGIWHIGAFILFDQSATGLRDVTLRANGATTVAIQRQNATSSATITNYVTVNADMYLDDGEYVEALGLQTSGGALDILAGCKFWAHLVSKVA